MVIPEYWINRYTYVLNNPLKYTDPSGYVYRYSRIENNEAYWEGYAWGQNMRDLNSRMSGGGGGGVGGSSRAYAQNLVENVGANPYWHFNENTGEYFNHKTGERKDAQGGSQALAEMGISHTNLVRKQTGSKVWEGKNGETYVKPVWSYIKEDDPGGNNRYRLPAAGRFAIEMLNIALIPKHPDATGISWISADLVYVAGISGQINEKITLKNGSQQGLKKKIKYDFGAGFGFDIGYSVVRTNYYYFGDYDKFTIDDFYGERVDASIDFGFYVEGGQGLVIMNVDGGFIIGVSRSVGISPFPGLSGNINFGRSTK